MCGILGGEPVQVTVRRAGDGGDRADGSPESSAVRDEPETGGAVPVGGRRWAPTLGNRDEAAGAGRKSAVLFMLGSVLLDRRD